MIARINRISSAAVAVASVDFKYPDNPQWKPALKQGVQVAYSVPVIVSEEGAMVSPEKKGAALAQIKTMGTVFGLTAWPYKGVIAAKQVRLVANGSFEGLLRDALAGRLDAVYINVDVANAMLRDVLNSPGQLIFDPGLPYARSDFSLSSVRYPSVIAEFDAFLKNERPLVEKLRKKYQLAVRSLFGRREQFILEFEKT
jgi:ABC-type amino acid transport substrate-binding protein